MLPRRPSRVVSWYQPKPSWRGPLKSSLAGSPRAAAASRKASDSPVRASESETRSGPPTRVVLGGAAHVVLGAQEVGQHVVPAPAQVGPLVVVGRVAADVDHRVDRRGPAERLAAREIDAAVVETRLEPGAEVPVRARAVVGREGGRDVDEVRRVRRPGLQEQDLHIGVLAQPVGEHAARRARADDHVVVHAEHTRARSTPCQPATAASAGTTASRRSMTSRAWRV